MHQTKHLIIALFILSAPAVWVGGCGGLIVGEVPESKAESPTPTVNADETWARLQPVYWTAEDGSKFMAPWHFWANPATSWLPDYAESIYRPLREVESATPYAWRPFYDTALRSPCLFYQTEDGETRCLPGWPQMEPDDLRDGFYAESTCSDVKRWLYALPTSETQGVMAQRYLVTAPPRAYDMPRVYEQRLFMGRVWWRYGAADGTRPCEEVTGSRFRFFERGDERPLTEFVKLGSVAVDLGPS